jgi:hypothetical protein
LGELVANSPPVWLLFELFNLKRGGLKKIAHRFEHPHVFGIDDAPPVVSKGIVSRTDVPMPDFQLFIKSMILD